MEQILKEILGEIKSMKADISDLKNGQAQVNERLERMEQKLDAVHGQVADNTERHTETMMKLVDIETKIEFLQHKETENERELYFLKKKIK